MSQRSVSLCVCLLTISLWVSIRYSITNDFLSFILCPFISTTYSMPSGWLLLLLKKQKKTVAMHWPLHCSFYYLLHFALQQRPGWGVSLNRVYRASGLWYFCLRFHVLHSFNILSSVLIISRVGHGGVWVRMETLQLAHLSYRLKECDKGKRGSATGRWTLQLPGAVADGVLSVCPVWRTMSWTMHHKTLFSAPQLRIVGPGKTRNNIIV